MSEIEKMYENAGIKTLKDCKHYLRGDGNWCNDNHDKNDIDRLKCPYCEVEDFGHPPFTAEKQIAILMFILNKFGDIGFQKMYSIRGNDKNTRKDFIKCLCDCEHETLDSRPVDFYYQNGASGDNFEESLAGLINTLWQDLTTEEKQQVKGILE